MKIIKPAFFITSLFLGYYTTTQAAEHTNVASTSIEKLTTQKKQLVTIIGIFREQVIRSESYEEQQEELERKLAEVQRELDAIRKSKTQ